MREPDASYLMNDPDHASRQSRSTAIDADLLKKSIPKSCLKGAASSLRQQSTYGGKPNCTIVVFQSSPRLNFLLVISSCCHVFRSNAEVPQVTGNSPKKPGCLSPANREECIELMRRDCLICATPKLRIHSKQPRSPRRGSGARIAWSALRIWPEKLFGDLLQIVVGENPRRRLCRLRFRRLLLRRGRLRFFDGVTRWW